MFDVITIGTATRDAFVRSREFKTVSSPEFPTGEAMCLPAGAKIDVDDIVFATGGGATNAAVTFARQGFQAATVCKIGHDISGREVLSNLKSECISTGFAVEDEKLKTAYAILILSSSGERTVLVYRGASEDIKVSDINPRTLNARWFYVVGSLPLDVLRIVLDKSQEIKAKVALNPSRSQIKLGLKGLGEVLKKLDVVIMNREEGAYLTGVDFKREEKIFSVLDEYMKGIVVLTDGPKGVWVSDGQNIYKAGIFKERQVADRTGAGDAFGSGFVSSLISNPNDIERAIKLASANATSVVESIGAKTGILTKDNFENDTRWKDLRIENRIK
ncbi:MAG: carbohydrate kinase family protein [Patescibacteria group bacterium]